ncbi:hypothetical protein [Streptomyces sp. PT12]|uniref:hypothetical protein n=1 Tax=Streptomyces sp. PT12 TaxID=1510197 RepID=UPI000DE452AE|nr:hypothetical protein [Streptomyces sp. PT12]RBM20774.1 hypothetical protein DEH69_07365 [Streptomyces sp. PT12]
MTTTIGPPAGSAAQRPPHRPRHRWLAAVVVALMIAIPAGYLVLSAYQSRDSGEDKARAASARTLVYEWPSKVQRRIYNVPIPSGSAYVGHFETNSWERSRLYAEFRCSPGQLSAFLEDAGADLSVLDEGALTIDDAHADEVGWRFDDPTREFAGAVIREPGTHTEVHVMVDLTSEERPRVYAVSISEP